ncbi:MAG: hypothetical protein ACE15E_07050 [Acidobacteriota bacterium]
MLTRIFREYGALLDTRASEAPVVASALSECGDYKTAAWPGMALHSIRISKPPNGNPAANRGGG